LRRLVGELAVEPLRTTTAPDARYVAAQVAMLRERGVARSAEALRSRLQRVNPVEEQAEYNRLFAELVDLDARRRQLREQAMGVL
ncbi:MAG: DNA primase, partial [Actinomycetota bacterium]|nr:DNA primase [Actinomycetota bacterium]